MKKALTMDPKDNVATVLEAIAAGDAIEVLSASREVLLHVEARDALPLGHKIALADIAERGDVVKYGVRIGRASKPILMGEYVHIHNVTSDRMPLTENMLGHTR